MNVHWQCAELDRASGDHLLPDYLANQHALINADVAHKIKAGGG